MSSYFYLLSSLPMLKADAEMPFSYSTFLQKCDSAPAKVQKVLKDLTLDSNTGTFVREWAEFYRVFKAELTYQRCQKLGRPCDAPSEREERITRSIAAAVADPNPLNAELALLSLQFEKLDELIGLRNFDEYSLIGYALKLKLLERKTIFDMPKGKAELGRLVENLQEKILNIE